MSSSDPLQPDDMHFQSGSVVAARYEIEEEVGRGGMAVVYRARDTRLDRSVALKVMQRELARAVGMDRFLREIDFASRLQHPHIVAVHDSGQVNGIPFYVMPLVPGESLRTRLAREKQLPLRDALQITREVGGALSYAHRQGIVHRDIKPENILLSSGQALLADFGIARAVSAAGLTTLTEKGLAIGTPAYMSPEQCAGGSELDGRSDIYALACVLFEMLAGDPPFGGATAQAIIARHLAEPPPSLAIVRPKTPGHVVQAINAALAKVPADRHGTVDEFVTALDAATADEPLPRNRWLIAATSILVAATAGGAVLRWGRPTDQALYANRVVVFPLVERGLAPGDTGAGVDVAGTVITQLEHTDPLLAIEGWRHLNERERANAALVSAGTQLRLSRERGAAFFIDGVVRRDEDSMTVTLRLYDVAGDSLIAQETSAGRVGSTPLYQVGLAALRNILPSLLDPGREVDLRALSERKASAIALWLQGERAYRRSQFASALELYGRAVREDSALTYAAIKGAQAASWENELSTAAQFAALASRQRASLPGRYRSLVLGLQAYLTGEADTAVTLLRQVIKEAPEWSEASMILGEVFYHLLPREYPLDSLAAASFRQALAADQTFTPALYHLAELALRDGNTQRARELIDRYGAVDPDTMIAAQLVFMLDCVRSPRQFDWQEAVNRSPRAVFRAAKQLSGAAIQTECAEGGFRAALSATNESPGYRWAALLGLQGILVARGHDQEVVALLDSAAAAGTQQAMSLYIIDAIAGARTEEKAAELDGLARRALGEQYERARNVDLLWLLGIWHARLGDVGRVRHLFRLADSLARTSQRRGAVMRAAALRAHLTLLEGDSAGALVQFQALVPTASRDSLTWELGEPLPAERMVLARLLFSRGEFEAADRVASGFDHPESVVYLPFIPFSLSLRLRAAVARERSDLASRYRNRLVRLGRADLVAAGR